MKGAFESQNRDLARQVASLRDTLIATPVPAVLERFRRSVIEICQSIEMKLERNLTVLAHDVESVHSDVLFTTSGCIQLFDLVNNQLSAPIIRFSARDMLPLSVLDWLHSAHPATRDKPFGVSSGGFAVYPHPMWPVVYFLPVSAQTSLRFLPLLFHEFGHLLYVLSKAELDDLIGEFQKTLRRVLAPRVIRDGQENNDAVRRQVQTSWREYWIQEIFCDAVGLSIGGSSFLHAFSHHFRFRSGDEYFIRQEDQLHRRHPVTWLRMQILLVRAERSGLGTAAAQVAGDWNRAAELFHVTQDFQGTWIDALSDPLQDLLDLMLEEVAPFSFHDANDASPHSAIDESWRCFFDLQGGPDVEERRLVERWMSAARKPGSDYAKDLAAKEL